MDILSHLREIFLNKTQHTKSTGRAVICATGSLENKDMGMRPSQRLILTVTVTLKKACAVSVSAVSISPRGEDMAKIHIARY